MTIQMNNCRFYRVPLLLVLVSFLSGSLLAQVSFKTKSFQLSFDNKGKLTEMRDLWSKTDYLYHDQASFLLSVKRNGVVFEPTGLQWKSKSSEAILSYA